MYSGYFKFSSIAKDQFLKKLIYRFLLDFHSFDLWLDRPAPISFTIVVLKYDFVQPGLSTTVQ